MPLLIALLFVAAIIYFAYVRNPNDTDEQATKKIARMALVCVVLWLIAAYGILKKGRLG